MLNAAKSIYPKSKVAYERRLYYVTSSLVCANSMKTTMNLVVQYFDLDVNVFKNVILILNKEIDLIKRLILQDLKSDIYVSTSQVHSYSNWKGH